MPSGSYRWTRFRAEANSATKRAWVVDAAWWWGGFYDGTRRELELGLTVKPNTHLALSARIDRNAIDLAAGGFTTDLMTARADYSFSPDMSWSSLVQYDSESRLGAHAGRSH